MEYIKDVVAKREHITASNDNDWGRGVVWGPVFTPTPEQAQARQWIDEALARVTAEIETEVRRRRWEVENDLHIQQD